MSIRLEELVYETVSPPNKGGQHVGLPQTGVKITHTPTGLSAFCAYENSQSKNREVALQMLEWGLTYIEYPNLL